MVCCGGPSEKSYWETAWKRADTQEKKKNIKTDWVNHLSITGQRQQVAVDEKLGKLAGSQCNDPGDFGEEDLCKEGALSILMSDT